MNSSTLLPAATPATFDLTSLPEAVEAGITSRTLVQGRNVRVTLFAFAPGQELTTHRSSRRALVQIIAGECAFEFSGRWQTLRAGTLLHLPPDAEHAVRATDEPFAMLLTLVAE